MTSEVHTDQRYSHHGKPGIVERIAGEERRDLPGGKVVEVWFRPDDGAAYPVDPGELRDEGAEGGLRT